MLMHQIEALLEAGVTQVVLAVSYRAEQMESELRAETDKVQFYLKVPFDVDFSCDILKTI
jgi:NDP-sugar pyrophosphorylase family protein